PLLLKTSNQNNMNPDMYVPQWECYLALITVAWLLGATLRVLPYGHGILLGNVIVGFAVHVDIDVLLNCEQVLLAGTVNGNGTLDSPLLTLGGDWIGGAWILRLCRICRPAGCKSLRGLFQIGCPLQL
ncbi:MAG: hypothetical protein ACKPKO_07675, partial [Candidatus Fonsibacter sp.]